jgi:hypothetical protein
MIKEIHPPTKIYIKFIDSNIKFLINKNKLYGFFKNS